MGDLTANFSFTELAYSELAGHWVKSNPTQFWLAKELAVNILQKGRNVWGRYIILSGIRDEFIVEALSKKGIHSSKTTDHAYLDPKVNQWGVGAADFTVPDVDMWEVYRWYIYKVQNKNIDVGQLIIYPERWFIHVSNPPSLVFSNEAISKVGLWKNKFMVAMHDGTFRRYEDYVMHG